MILTKKIIIFLLILAINFANIGVLVSRVKAEGENLIFNPGSISASTNQEDIEVNVYVQGDFDLKKVNFNLEYDNTLIEYTGYSDSDLGDFLKFNCASYQDTIYEASPGLISAETSRGLCEDENVSVQKKVVTLHFRALGSIGEAGLNFTNISLENTEGIIEGITSSIGTVSISLPTPQITISNEVVNLGENAVVSITGSDFIDISTIGMEIIYDSSALTYSEFNSPLEVSGWTIFVDELSIGTLSITIDGFGQTPISGNQTLLNLGFLTNLAGTSTIEIDSSDPFATFLYNEGFEELETIWNNGSVEVLIPDTTPPLRSLALPSGSLPAGTTNTEISLVTDEDAICKYSTVADTSFASSTNTFSSEDGLNHSSNVSGLIDGNNYNYYVRCEDELGNVNEDDYLISFFISLPTPQITISNEVVNLGENAVVSITGSDFIDISTIGMEIIYDSSALTYSEFNSPLEDSLWTIFVDKNSTGILSISMDGFGQDPISGNQTLLNLGFLTNLAGTSTIEIDSSDPFATFLYNEGFEELEAIWNNGSIEVLVPDTEAPVRSAKSPSGSLSAGTTNTEISLVTDEDAICKYSTIADTSFASSANTFSTTGSTTHSTLVSGLSNGNTYNYYIRCEDASSNENTDDYVITFSVASPAPSSSGGGGGGGGYVSPVDTTAPGQITDLKMEREGESVSLTWKNPSDSDFAGVLVVRSETELYSYTEQSSAKQIGTEIYQGKNEAYTDSISENLEYYYLLYTFDNNNNYSKAMVLKTSPVPTNTDNEGSQSNNESEQSQTSSAKYKSLAGVSSQIVEEVSRSEAGFVYRFNSFVDLDELHRNLYNRVVKESDTYLNDESKYSIAFFIRYGTDTTLVLGAGERAGVINSYKSVFNRLPQTEEEWSDVVKIANGRWPSERNMTAEQKAQSELFRTIYKREANMNNANDNAAVTVITYGLRPADRNMDSEKAGIKIFEGIFGYKPSSAIDWDIVRAISYSGAIR